MSENRPAVVFLFGHNAGRSQMAAGRLRHWELTDPTGRPIELLRSVRHEIKPGWPS